MRVIRSSQCIASTICLGKTFAGLMTATGNRKRQTFFFSYVKRFADSADIGRKENKNNCYVSHVGRLNCNLIWWCSRWDAVKTSVGGVHAGMLLKPH